MLQAMVEHGISPNVFVFNGAHVGLNLLKWLKNAALVVVAWLSTTSRFRMPAVIAAFAGHADVAEAASWLRQRLTC